MVLSFDDLTRVVQSAISTLPKGHLLSEGDALTALGIDSLTTLNILVTVAEQFNLDLGQLSEDAPPPSSLGELFGLLTGLDAPQGAQ